MDWTFVGRLCVFIVGILACGFMSFMMTPELDGVENAFIYRASLFMMMMRGWGYLCFNVFGFFPLQG